MVTTARLVPSGLPISLPPLGDGMSVSVRRWQSVVVAAMVLIAVVMSGCTSPGTPFSYLDVKISVGPSASPVQPVVGQATSINFTIRNTWNQPLTAVAWEIRENSDPLVPTSGPVIASGVTDIVAFGSSAQTFALGGLAKGTHTYAVIVDPTNVIAEQNESNNTFQFRQQKLQQHRNKSSAGRLFDTPRDLNGMQDSRIRRRFENKRPLGSAIGRTKPQRI